MFMARPHRRALAFLGSGFGRLLTTHRESARWLVSLHHAPASLQGWIAHGDIIARLRHGGCDGRAEEEVQLLTIIATASSRPVRRLAPNERRGAGGVDPTSRAGRAGGDH